LISDIDERVLEMAPSKELFFSPLHPYTSALMSAIPAPDPDAPMQPIILKEYKPDHFSACHFSDSMEQPGAKELGESSSIRAPRLRPSR